MRSLFAFFFQIRFFILFVLLEAFCGWLIVRNNSYQSFAFLSSANRLVGGLYATTNRFNSYFLLGEENQKLLAENAALQQQLYTLRQAALLDSSILGTFDLQIIPAKVINNTLYLNENYLTINKGARHGIVRGMGVISPQGIVGQVKDVSDHFATAYSFLHSSVSVSSRIRRTKTLVTAKWLPTSGAVDYTQADLQYVPFHVSVEIGDTIETSGFNSVYPEGIPVGYVSQVFADTSKNFQTVRIKLATAFDQVSNVYVVADSLKNEKIQLESGNK